MLMVELLGGSGAGKSTVKHRLYAALQEAGCRVVLDEHHVSPVLYLWHLCTRSNLLFAAMKLRGELGPACSYLYLLKMLTRVDFVRRGGRADFFLVDTHLVSLAQKYMVSLNRPLKMGFAADVVLELRVSRATRTVRKIERDEPVYASQRLTGALRLRKARKVAAILQSGGVDNIVELLTRWNDRFCDPPLGDKELSEVAAIRHGALPLGRMDRDASRLWNEVTSFGGYWLVRDNDLHQALQPLVAGFVEDLLQIMHQQNKEVNAACNGRLYA